MTDETTTAQGPSSRTRLRVSVFGAVCLTGVFVLMANDRQLPHGALLGFLLMFGVLLGLYAALGLLVEDASATPLAQTSWGALPGEANWQAPRVTAPIALALVSVVAFTLGGHVLPYAIVLALCLLLVSAVRRPGLFVFVAASALYLPQLGANGLWDPWETHYGEVSREILSRDDWISLWWAQDKWFWSKPILIFWSEALTWSASGVDFRPDTHAPHTEWVLRIPIFFMALAGLCAVYGAVQRIFGKRAGVLSALVLATTPYYSMLTHQAITDMPFVANMTVATMLLVLGLTEDPERRVQSIRIQRWAFSAQHAVIALIVMIGLPQILYLASRNITFISGLFAWHRDEFLFGSGGNPDVPGNFGIHAESPHVRAFVMEPLGQALIWLASLSAIVFTLRKETRVQQLYMYAFYAFCALAFMAKGIPGFALPGLVAALCLLATGRFEMLFSGKLRVALGILIVTTLGLPWFVAMFVRHGPAFTDRILIHDHINRLTTGVHGDNGTIQYFIWQLGYGLFPWIALIPIALASWLTLRSDEAGAQAGDADRARSQRDLLMAMGLWFATAFTLFSAMTTKFHHYIFPAVPPAAVLTGLLLDRLLGGTRLFDAAGAARKKQLLVFAASFVAPTALALGIAGLRGDARGVVPGSVAKAARESWVLAHPWPLAASLAFIVGGALIFAFAARALRSLRTDVTLPRLASAAISIALVCGALLAAFVGRDLSWHTKAGPPGSERLIHLFVYNYGRPWPDYLDYRPILFGFATVMVLLVVLAASRALRHAALLSLIGIASAFTLWSLDIYMADLAPHWSQAGLIDRYYEQRKSAAEPLVSWQMNWKGENFYTGNRTAVFVDLDNKKLDEWVKKNPGKKAFFILEHGRLERLKRQLAPRPVKSLSDMRDCNKFVLVSTTL